MEQVCRRKIQRFSICGLQVVDHLRFGFILIYLTSKFLNIIKVTSNQVIMDIPFTTPMDLRRRLSGGYNFNFGLIDTYISILKYNTFFKESN